LIADLFLTFERGEEVVPRFYRGGLHMQGIM
jgi:hypothetical protein